MAIKSLIINPGSTSTKIGVFEDETLLFEKTLRHSTEEIAQYASIADQKDFRKEIITTCLAGFVASIFTTLIGWFTANLYICIPFILVSCIPLGVLNVVSNAMIGDCLDYLELQTGYRDNGLGSALQGFVNKLGNALATTGIILMYIFIGIDPSKMLSSEVVVAATELTRTQNFAMFTLVSIIPGISMLLCAVPMFFYKISGKERTRIIEALAQRRQAQMAEITD